MQRLVEHTLEQSFTRATLDVCESIVKDFVTKIEKSGWTVTRVRYVYVGDWTGYRATVEAEKFV